uniref:Putative cathepsin b-like cysteine protease form 1 n=1 Tax=Ixodes ricinus TaxID=34613 RepID=A0A090XD06_IXORI
MLKSLLVVGLLAAVCFGREIHPKRWHPLSDQMINFINKINTTWKAGRNFDKSISMSYIRGLMGVNPKSKEYRLPQFVHEEIPDDLPESFDAREKWSHCASINLIRDQSTCGSCWAFGAAEAMSDRVCIHSEGNDPGRHLGRRPPWTAAISCGDGCNGRISPRAASGNTRKDERTREWWPRTAPPTAASLTPSLPANTTPKALCLTAPGSCPRPSACISAGRATATDYQADKHFGKKVYSISSDEKQIQTEIFKNGPVEADFTVYADFLSYKSGVYQHQSGDVLGGHAIRILGWGTENGTPLLARGQLLERRLGRPRLFQDSSREGRVWN